MFYTKTGNTGLLTVLIILSGIILTTVNSCYYDKAELLYPDQACDTSLVKYSTAVVPVLSSACISCHGGGTPSAGISLDTYAGVKTQVNNGRLWGSISHNPGYSPMPKNSNKLSNCNLEKINKWITAGAPNN